MNWMAIISRFGGFFSEWQVAPITVQWSGGELYV